MKTASLARREENLRGRNSQWNPMDMNDVFMYIYILHIYIYITIYIYTYIIAIIALLYIYEYQIVASWNFME